jgi:hypothetical protein
MKTTIIAGALFLAAAVPALADPPATAPATTPAAKPVNICLYRHQIDGWGSRGDHSLVVNDRFGKKYLVNVAGLCSDLNWAFGVGVRPVGGDHPCVERGDHIVMRGGGVLPGEACWVTKVQYYTPDMQKADKTARDNKQPLATY